MSYVPNLVSVVVPLFNHAQFLRACLESVSSQSYAMIELLVCDDGSSDNSYEILEMWVAEQSNRFYDVKIFKQQNSGICKTLNKLIKESRGEYIKPLASDDELLPDALSDLVGFSRNQKVGKLVFSEVRNINYEGKELVQVGRFANIRLVGRFSEDILLALEVSTSWGSPFNNQFFKRDFYNSIGGYDESLPFEDFYFAMCALGSKALAYMQRPTLRYRVRSDVRVTPGLTAAQYDDRLTILCRTQKFFSLFSFHWFILAFLYTNDGAAAKIVRIFPRTFKFFLKKFLT